MFLKSCPWPRVCNKCGEAKPIDQFKSVHRGNGVYGKAAHCKACRPKDKNQKEYDRRYREKLKARRADEKATKIRNILAINPNYFAELKQQTQEERKIKAREYSKRNYNSEIACKRARDRRINNLEHVRELERNRGPKRKRKEIDNLSDTYIKNILTTRNSLKFEDIPDSLITLKRAQLTARRLIKNIGG